MMSGSSDGQTAIWVKGCQTWARSRASSRSCRDESMDACLLQCLERAIDLRLRVCGGEGEPETARSLGNGGWTDGLHEEPTLAQEGRGAQGTLWGAEDDRNDRAPGLGGESQPAQAVDEVADVAPEAGTELGVRFQQIHRHDDRLAQRRREGGGEH